MANAVSRTCHYALYATALLVLLLVSYAVSYAALVRPGSVYIVNLGTCSEVKVPSYRFLDDIFGSEAVEAFFTPVHDLDYRLRPDTWKATVAENPPTGGFF